MSEPVGTRWQPPAHPSSAGSGWAYQPAYAPSQPHLQHPQYAQPAFDPRYTVRPPGTHGLAVAALVLSILWLGWVGSLVGIVLGHVALHETKRTGQAGHAMAVTALVLGYLGLALFVVMVAVLLSLQGPDAVDPSYVPV